MPCKKRQRAIFSLKMKTSGCIPTLSRPICTTMCYVKLFIHKKYHLTTYCLLNLEIQRAFEAN